MEIGWGLIGPGQHADRYILPAINQSARGKLIAICHYRKERAEFFAKRNGAKRSYSTLEEMLHDSEVQVVDVATPDSQHKEHVIQAARAGKHVRCEFPLGVTVDEAKEMVEACRQAGVKLAVGYAWAHHPIHQRMRNIISSGAIGEVTFAEGDYTFPWGGGILGGQIYWKVPPRTDIEYPPMNWKFDSPTPRRNALAHLGIPIYMLRFLLGREVEEMSVFADAQAEDKAIAMLKFAGDLYAFAQGNHVNPYGERSITIFGTEGKLRAIGTLAWGSTGVLEITRLRSKGIVSGLENVSKSVTTNQGLFYEGEKSIERIKYPGANIWVDSIEAFNKCISEGEEPVPSGIDGLRERQLSAAAMESISSGKAVKISVE